MKIGRRGALALLAGAAAATGPFGRVAAAPPADGGSDGPCAAAIGVPHAGQKRSLARTAAPHDAHTALRRALGDIVTP